MGCASSQPPPPPPVPVQKTVAEKSSKKLSVEERKKKSEHKRQVAEKSFNDKLNVERRNLTKMATIALSRKSSWDHASLDDSDYDSDDDYKYSEKFHESYSRGVSTSSGSPDSSSKRTGGLNATSLYSKYSGTSTWSDAGVHSTKSQSKFAEMPLNRSWIVVNNCLIDKKSRLAIDTLMRQIMENAKYATDLPKFKPLPDMSEVDSHRSFLFDLKVVNLLPLKNFDVNVNNINDFSLPAGLITIESACRLVELYKQGGRLSTESLHKLLRISHRSLERQPNISRTKISQGVKLNVVGDLHGQLPDLLHIIKEGGMPSPQNKYLFNGDFVDRGDNGLEVACIILAFHCAAPRQVFLNRGNHEDFAICNAYGFQVEVFDKYDEVTFSMFMEVFQQIPLCAVINEAIFIVHGGLFHKEETLLSEIESIRRDDFTLLDMPEGGESIVPVDKNTNNAEYMKQLQRDMLWSDPRPDNGIQASARGAGIQFGADVVRKFLELNNMKMMIRSHECVQCGCVSSFTGEDKNLAYTLFSASDYGGAGNGAAFMVIESSSNSSVELADVSLDTRGTYKTSLRSDKMANVNRKRGSMERMKSDFGEIAASLSMTSINSMKSDSNMTCDNECIEVEGTDMFFTVHQYFMRADSDDTRYLSNTAYKGDDDITVVGDDAPKDFNDRGSPMADRTTMQGVPLKDCSTYLSLGDSDSSRTELTQGMEVDLFEMIMKKRIPIIEGCEDKDVLMKGLVDTFTFARILKEQVMDQFDWEELIQFLLYEEAIEMNGFKTMLNYNELFEILQNMEFSHTLSKSDVDKLCYQGHQISTSVLQSLYHDHQNILSVFEFFDVSKTELISKAQFIEGCKRLNLFIPEGGQKIELSSVDIVMSCFESISGTCIGTNFFFELVRLARLGTESLDLSTPTKNQRAPSEDFLLGRRMSISNHTNSSSKDVCVVRGESLKFMSSSMKRGASDGEQKSLLEQSSLAISADIETQVVAADNKRREAARILPAVKEESNRSISSSSTSSIRSTGGRVKRAPKSYY
jgi:diadenosine tetraphosphatase ApaH/serine/threonine PP2A family protein phosphatase